MMRPSSPISSIMLTIYLSYNYGVFGFQVVDIILTMFHQVVCQYNDLMECRHYHCFFVVITITLFWMQ